MIVVTNRKLTFFIALILSSASLFILILSESNNEYFGRTIDARLQNIVHPKDSSVWLSSRAEDYINASYEDYQYIIEHGKRSLNYLLYKFSINKEDGLEQYIMAIACSEILKENREKQSWMTGRDWYNKYLKNARK